MKRYIMKSQHGDINNSEVNYNHDKGNEIRRIIDANGEIYKDVYSRIKEAWKLTDFAEEEGAKISYGNFPYNNIQRDISEKIVTAAEIIHDCLKDESIKEKIVHTNRDVFGVVLNNLLYGLQGLREEDFNDIVDAIGEIYDAEI